MPGDGGLTGDTATMTGLKIGYARVSTDAQDLTVVSDTGNMATDFEHQIQTAIGELVGSQCIALGALTRGKSLSHTYTATLVSSAVVVKTNDDIEALSRSVHNLEVLADLGIPVPRVIAYDDSTTSLPAAILVMEQLPGRDLHYELASMTPKQMSVLAEKIVGFQRLAATLSRSSGFGYAGIDENVTGSWSDIARRPSGYAWADPLPDDTQSLFGRLQKCMDQAEPYFATVEPICFLDDLTTKNVLIRDGELTGVVDFDWVAYGDPLLHLGLCAAAVTANAPPHCQHYVEELIRFSGLNSHQRGIVGLYQASYLVNFLGAESPDKPGDWRVTSVAGATAGLDAFQLSIDQQIGLAHHAEL